MKKKFYLGCSGWFYWHWLGRFYPEDLKPNGWLDYYTKRFNSVEVNSTFYHFPKESMVKNWRKKSPNDFKFTLKANRFITHIKKFKGVRKQIKDFYKTAALLEEKLGCILFQLPPSLHFNEKKLEEICSELNADFDNVIEFRHNSWFENEKTFEILKENKIGYCIVSAPGIDEVVKETSKNAYVRFHGKHGWFMSSYPNRELKEWAERMKRFKAKNVWAYFNNDFNAYAPKNCLCLKKLLKA